VSTPNSVDKPTVSREWGYSRAWRLFSVIILWPLLRLLMRYEWQGRENFPRAGGVILAPNHLSYADWPTVALFSYVYGHRYPVFLIKSAVFEVKVLGPLMYKLGQLPVYRGRGDAGLVLKQAEQALHKGACVVVYPEGTATRDPGLWPMAGKTGAARLALTTGAPVIPIAHWGAQDVLPYGSKRPHLFPRKTIRMAAGPAVDLSAYAGQRLSASTLRAATAAIMADITALLAKVRQQAPPAVPWDPAVAGRPSSLGRTGVAEPVPSAVPQPGGARAEGPPGPPAATGGQASRVAAGGQASRVVPPGQQSEGRKSWT
jgi:1-acyl-sn-glycerol-3-phosphate acyltransferase